MDALTRIKKELQLQDALRALLSEEISLEQFVSLARLIILQDPPTHVAAALLADLRQGKESV